MRLILQPDSSLRLGDYLRDHLRDVTWEQFQAAVAFIKYSGVRHVASALSAFSSRGGVKISVGVDFGGTTAEGLKALIECVGPDNEVWAYHNETGSTFHPKVYLFKAADGRAEIVIGSGNLTEGGIFTNYEAGVAFTLAPRSKEEARLLREVEAALKQWRDPKSGLARRVDLPAIEALLAQGYILTEHQAEKLKATKTTAARSPQPKSAARKPLFAGVSVGKAPRAPTKRPGLPTFLKLAAAAASIEVPPTTRLTGFLMTLQRTDVGVGQVTSGTSRRSPEIFVPLAARDFAPAFWDWPTAFVADASMAGKMDRMGVKMWLGTKVIDVNMMTWPPKHDFRLRSEALRSAGNIGDILRLEKVDSSIGFDYLVYIVPQGTMEYRHYITFCVHHAKGKSKKLWGYY